MARPLGATLSTFDLDTLGGGPTDGWTAASGTWTPRSQAYTNDPAAGANIELEMVDTSGLKIGDLINVSSGAGNEDTPITVVHDNVHLTVAKLWLNHDTTNPLVRLSSALPGERAYTNDPAAGANIELNIIDTSIYAVGNYVEVSSSAGREYATVTVVHANTHIIVDNLTLNHTTVAPLVRIMTQGTYIVDTSIDQSANIGVGDKIKFTDTTVKYFIVHAIATTRLTLFGGTDYSIVGTAAVTSPSYSHARCPFAFPMSPDKWKVEILDTASRTQASPVASTKYNLGTISITIPIGMWRGYFEVFLESDVTGTGVDVYGTLSTANNSESDNSRTAGAFAFSASAAIRAMSSTNKNLSVELTSKATHYLNGWTTTAAVTGLYFRGDLAKTIIRLYDAYL